MVRIRYPDAPNTSTHTYTLALFIHTYKKITLILAHDLSKIMDRIIYFFLSFISFIPLSPWPYVNQALFWINMAERIFQITFIKTSPLRILRRSAQRFRR
jgi:hypothetical protein